MQFTVTTDYEIIYRKFSFLYGFRVLYLLIILLIRVL